VAFGDGPQPLWGKSVTGIAWGVNFARNDSVVLAANGDGTIRWYRWSDGQELLALFVDAKDRRWVAWTPTGYYLASPGGEDLIGWQVNRGFEQEADFFPASRFRERFNRPDIVRLVLETLDEGEAVKQANAASGKRENVQPVAARLPPVVTILSPAGMHFSGDEVTIEYTLRSPSGLPIDRVDSLVEGRTVQARGLTRPGGADSFRRSLTLPVPAHDVEIGLIARSGDLVGDVARLHLVYDGSKPAGPELLKPKLFAVVAGVSDYADPSLKLGFAAADAKAFADALKSQTGGLYGSVELRLLPDKAASRADILDALDWLDKEVTSRDVGVVFLAGHGVTDARLAYWYLPADASPDRLRATAISQDEIRTALQALAGKALLFLDTCHAGSAGSGISGGFDANAPLAGVKLASADPGLVARGTVDVNSVASELAAAENGVVVFASSTGRELSFEREDWGHGAFTLALVEGIAQGKADLLHGGTVTVSELDAYLADRVKTLTGGHQHPVMTRPATVPDFPIAVVRK
jgi:hypothetical protein